jgi:hypothetical protein
MGKVFFVCFGPKRYRFGIEQKLGVVVVGNEFFPNKFAQTRKKQEINDHRTIFINKACQTPDPMSLGGAKEYFKVIVFGIFFLTHQEKKPRVKCQKFPLCCTFRESSRLFRGQNIKLPFCLLIFLRGKT